MSDTYLATLSSDSFLQPRKQSTDNLDSLFLLEVDGVCPKCGKPLMKTKGKRGHKAYQIAHIYPNSPTEAEYKLLDGLERLGTDCEDRANKLALCKDCHGYFDDHKTKEEYLWFVAKKKELTSKTLLKLNGYNFNLQDEIRLVLEAISNVSADQLSEITYTGVFLAEKIDDSEILLRNKIANYVTLYFSYIQSIFRELHTAEKLNFDLIASEVKTYFLKCEAEKAAQNQIFYALVDWIKLKSGTQSTEASEAIVSFFVQDCEVFHALPK